MRSDYQTLNRSQKQSLQKEEIIRRERLVSKWGWMAPNNSPKLNSVSPTHFETNSLLTSVHTSWWLSTFQRSVAEPKWSPTHCCLYCISQQVKISKEHHLLFQSDVVQVGIGHTMGDVEPNELPFEVVMNQRRDTGSSNTNWCRLRWYWRTDLRSQ